MSGSSAGITSFMVFLKTPVPFKLFVRCTFTVILREGGGRDFSEKEFFELRLCFEFIEKEKRIKFWKDVFTSGRCLVSGMFSPGLSLPLSPTLYPPLPLFYRIA